MFELTPCCDSLQPHSHSNYNSLQMHALCKDHLQVCFLLAAVRQLCCCRTEMYSPTSMFNCYKITFKGHMISGMNTLNGVKRKLNGKKNLNHCLTITMVYRKVFIISIVDITLLQVCTTSCTSLLLILHIFSDRPTMPVRPTSSMEVGSFCCSYIRCW